MKLEFVAVFTELSTNYCAYLPDLPGCVSTGTTWKEIQEMIQEAVEFHIEGMLKNGDPLPEERMSAQEAMLHHCEPLSQQEIEEYSQYGDCPTVLSVTFKEIEVEVAIPSPVTTT